ncbi:MAG: ABC transporter ATP-binding protein [Rhodobacteraceae bacterium]|nr:ABC transporter ATP-binding protein [Paracoccaceae bacterium]
MVAPALKMSGVTKRFGPVLANDRVDLQVAPGTIHGIIGENGAGKSTLVSILYGFHAADEGEIEITGRPVTIRDSADAIGHGVGMVHQHFMLVPNFTVLENVMLGAEGGLLLKSGRAAARAELDRLARDYGLEVDPDAIVEELPVGLQQRVEILKALRRGAQILILDEPTGVLTPAETERFFDILRNLRAQGVTILLITHKLQEIIAVTDDVTVLRGGRVVGRRATAETTRDELAELMVGAKTPAIVNRGQESQGEAVISAENLTWRDLRGVARLEDVSLTLRAGEILGLAGVSGNGQSELLDVLSGVSPVQEGRIRVGAREITRTASANPAEMRRLGVGHVPEDRHRCGLVLGFEARANAVLGYHNGPNAGPGLFLSLRAMERHCTALIKRFDVRPGAPRLRAGGFSGGNQQKLVIGREIEAEPKAMLIGQPTRGVDIGGIAAIHAEILARRAAGCAILLVSVELEEIFALSDRIAVINDGRIVGETPRRDADVKTIGLMMAGVSRNAPEAAA